MACLEIGRPQGHAVGVGDDEMGDFLLGNESKSTFVDGVRKLVHGDAAIEEEHQPVAGIFVVIFGNNAEEVKVVDGEGEAGFFPDLAYGGAVRGFTGGHFQLSSDGTPETEIRSFVAFHEQQMALRVSQVNKSADFVRERFHERNRVGGSFPVGKPPT